MSHSVQIDIHGLPFSIETGKVAKQADGAVVVRFGASMVLATVVGAKSAREGQDFFPLTVEYRERAYAGGRIPGGYFKREGAPVKKEILTCRLIDRPIRPLFPEGFRNEIQVICLVISGDPQHDPDVLAMNGASAALSLSGHPVHGPVGAVRVGLVDGQFIANPTTARAGSLAARARRGGHRGRRADGRGGRQGSVRGQDAGGDRLRPRAVPAAGARCRRSWWRRPPSRAGRSIRTPARIWHWPRGSVSLASAQAGGRARPPTKSTRAPRPSRACSTTCGRASVSRTTKKGAVRAAFEEVESAEVRRMIVERGLRVDGRKVDRDPADLGRGRVSAAGPRLVAVHARRDPGAGLGHARHQVRRAEDRGAGGRVLPPLPAALQLPLVLGRRGAALRLALPPRHRSRRARRAGGRGGAARQGRVPVHDPRGVRHPRVQRLLVDGQRSAAPRWR